MFKNWTIPNFSRLTSFIVRFDDIAVLFLPSGHSAAAHPGNDVLKLPLFDLSQIPPVLGLITPDREASDI
jgi:hypothetical protein